MLHVCLLTDYDQFKYCFSRLKRILQTVRILSDGSEKEVTLLFCTMTSTKLHTREYSMCT